MTATNPIFCRSVANEYSTECKEVNRTSLKSHQRWDRFEIPKKTRLCVHTLTPAPTGTPYAVYSQ